MKVQSVSYDLKKIRITFDCYDDLINKDDIFEIEVENKSYYFVVEKIEVYSLSPSKLNVVAEETGYWHSKFLEKHSDIRLLLNKNIWKIVDKEKIKKVEEESCYL